MKCSNCQELLLEDDLFCENCGERVVQLTDQSVAQQVVPENRKRISPWLLAVLGVIILLSLILCFGVAYLVELPPLGEPPPLDEAPPLEDNSGGLTPQELAHQGTHTYELTCANESLNGSMVWTFEFIDGGLDVHDGGLPYSKIGVNTYGVIGCDDCCTWTFTSAEARKECPGELSCVFRRE